MFIWVPLAGRVQREANVLAYIDGFELCLWLAIAALFLIAFMTYAPQGAFTPDPPIVGRLWRRLSNRSYPLLRRPD
jgi:hypothetical protein